MWGDVEADCHQASRSPRPSPCKPWSRSRLHWLITVIPLYPQWSCHTPILHLFSFCSCCQQSALSRVSQLILPRVMLRWPQLISTWVTLLAPDPPPKPQAASTLLPLTALLLTPSAMAAGDNVTGLQPPPLEIMGGRLFPPQNLGGWQAWKPLLKMSSDAQFGIFHFSVSLCLEFYQS